MIKIIYFNFIMKIEPIEQIEQTEKIEKTEKIEQQNNDNNGLYGYQMVLLWLILFFVIIYPLIANFSVIDKTIMYWCFLTIFVFLFEMMFMYNYNYVCDKGGEYFKNKKCYWTEKVNLSDMFSDKMYLDLYADYSLADYKYRQNMNDSGFHFVYFGEIWHGIFAGLLSILVIYYKFFNNNLKKYHLSYFTLGITQLVMIIWYMSPAILELFLQDHQNNLSNTFWPPHLWNVPWFILPSILIYNGLINIID